MAKQTVAIVGASSDRSKYSNKAVRAYVQQGWAVYPINPKGGTIEGLEVYKSLRDVPVKIDRVSLYLPPSVGINALEVIVAKKPGEFYVNPGAESEALIEKARTLGLDPIQACSIIELGVTPAQFPG